MKAMSKIMTACRTCRGDRKFGSLSRAASWGIAALLALLATAPRSEALVLANAEAAVGQWDLSLEESSRKCRLTLRQEGAGNLHALSMPAGCRRALPILADANAWTVPVQDHVDLTNAAGKPLLDFIAAGADGFLAQGPEGETYRFVAVSPANFDARLVAPDSRSSHGFEPVQVATGPTKTKTPVVKPGDIAGRYSVLREGGKDTGCMLTLDSSGNKANLAPACRDQGIVIFDPTSWQFAAGRLVLRARKGHTTHLDMQEDGTWLKDPQEGKALSLKKM
jgi:Protease inhibitor Inh